jgi:Spy/CpxP family protein refolding chaperone
MTAIGCGIAHAEGRKAYMNRIRIFTIVIALLIANGAFAQSAPAHNDSGQQGSGRGHAIPTAEEQLKLLSERLELTGDQQAKVKPILQELHDATQKFLQDESMSHDERMDNVRASHYKADRKVREVLNDDQKKKLDQLEQEQHAELHGNVHG